VQTLEQMKNVKLTSDMFKEEEEEEGWKSEPPTTILSALEGTDTARKRQSLMSMLTQRLPSAAFRQGVQTSAEKKHQQHQVTILMEHGTAKMGPRGCGKTSVNNCQNMLHNKPKVWRPCPKGSRSLKSQKVFPGFLTLESETSALTKKVGYLSVVTQHHIPEERRPQLHQCKSIKPHTAATYFNKHVEEVN
jgi:hypothetical protein